ncbi:hemerythrin domain-containing protein [Microbacterium sp. STN6]|uniref:hemerythrin domain-containing protein n=1 Tax=Microbacterium sp. STN6 TaxID=2995588 RepID=UPI0022609847|nr:hemerythrin domain-containing protein [Microbacterium sp. STN6]MCX7523441.1 hemerythrin domain-containing protein [Microbacterium sp. STN6]
MSTLAEALEREHRDIDGGIEQYTARLAAGTNDVEPLKRAMAGLRRHIYLEEQFLFPPLQAMLMMPVMVMLKEHGELWRSMDSLDVLLAAPPSDDALLEACRELLAQLDRHNSKEEPIIYTRADDVLSAEASGELSAFLDEGRMPEGWSCAKAAAGPSLP